MCVYFPFRLRMKTEYKAGDLSKLLASASPKSDTSMSTPSNKNKRRKSGKQTPLSKEGAKTPASQTKVLQANDSLNKATPGRNVESNKKGKNENVDNTADDGPANKNVVQAKNLFSPDKKEMANKSEGTPGKKGKSFGFYKRLEKKVIYLIYMFI